MDIWKFFSEFIDAPTKMSISNSIQTLYELGAIEDTNNQVLTKLGKVLSMISLEPRLSKLLV